MSEKIERRRHFLQHCSPDTISIHEPILDAFAVDGALNPAGLGDADMASGRAGLGQSSVWFDTLAAYRHADDLGLSPYNGTAEYGIVRTASAAALCDRLTALHGGSGAIVCPSGMSAIAAAMEAFAPKSIAVPDCVYRPLVRYIEWLNSRHETPAIAVFRYAGAADAAAMETLRREAQDAGTPIDTIYLEAPGSGTFEIPDIAGIVAVAQAHGIRTMMDNTWASHVRFRPLAHGIDIAIQATTKYEGGYADTPSGAVVARTPEDFKRLLYASRVLGIGAVAPQTCLRLLHRIESTEARMDRHYASALQVMTWLNTQPYVAGILCPALESSPGHDRFRKYFGKGNGLFTVAFANSIGVAQAEAFMDALTILRIAESWGGHVSLVLPVKSKDAPMIRFSIGLEDPRDLIRDIETAARTFV